MASILGYLGGEWITRLDWRVHLIDLVRSAPKIAEKIY
jgi:hypothetical protein